MKAFVITGIISAAVTGLLLYLAQQSADADLGRVIRITKSSSPVAGDEELGRGWWEQQQFDQFVQRHGWGNIHLNVKTVVGDYLQKYVASAVAGEAPDIVQLEPQELAHWYDQGLLEPLDRYVQKWDAYRDGHLNETVLNAGRGVNGELLCLPFQLHGPAMFGIRRHWLEYLNLKKPETWEQAFEVWRAFTFDDPDGNGKDDTYGYVMEMRTDRGQHAGAMQVFFYAAGVRWFGADAQGRVRPAFNRPAAADALDLIKRAYQQGLFGKDVMLRNDEGGDVQRFLSQRNAGMTSQIYPNFYKGEALRHGMYDKVDLIAFLWKDEQYRRKDIYGTPTFLSGPRCMLKSSRDKDTAWKFFEYWLSRDALTQAYSKRGNARERYIGRFGLYTPAAPWLPMRNDIPITAKIEPWIEKLARPLDRYIVTQPFVATWSQISSTISQVFVDYYLDRFPNAQAALDEAERRAVGIMEKYEAELAGKGAEAQ
jgi:ABC-type glycerol-3-phosphate transport system substrate-binding protein